MSDEIKLEFMASGASDYQFGYNPDKMLIWFEHIQVPHELGSGITKFYHKGYKFMAQLSWKAPVFFRDDQYDRLRQIFNLHDGLTVTPCPDSCAGACYAVNWSNDFTFVLVEGVTPFGYVGTMILEGSEVLSEIDEDIVMGKG